MPRIEISTFDTDDIPFGKMINEEQNWLMTDADWSRLVELGEECILKATVDGEGAGMVGAVPYDRMAYVHSMLVRPKFRRMGVATALLRECTLRLKERGVPTIKLDAEQGVDPLYESLGFEKEWSSHKFLGYGRPERITATKVEKRDLDSVIRYDREVTGVDRYRALSLLYEGSHIALMIQDQEVQGYLLARPGRGRVEVGPLVADSVSMARELILSLMGTAPNHRLRMFVPGHNGEAITMLNEVGMRCVDSPSRMFMGERFVESPNVFVMMSPEKG